MMYRMLGWEGKSGVLKPFWPANPVGGETGGVSGICLLGRSMIAVICGCGGDVARCEQACSNDVHRSSDINPSGGAATRRSRRSRRSGIVRDFLEYLGQAGDQ
jgi:hypothetical protein